MEKSTVPPSGGSREIGNFNHPSYPSGISGRSPFGGIPRNWKPPKGEVFKNKKAAVPPSGGSLEIGNKLDFLRLLIGVRDVVPPSGGSLEIGNGSYVGCPKPSPLQRSPFGGIPRNWKLHRPHEVSLSQVVVPPSGGSLEIGNMQTG